MIKKLLILFLLFNATKGFAQTSATTNTDALIGKSAPVVKTNSKAASNVLDFEAEVIEGEKKRPELFLDITAGDGRVGSGLYMRPNFDDFFSVDKSHRPQFKKAK